MKRFFLFVALAVTGLALFSACGADIDLDGGAKGVLEGRVTIGPECPVEPCDTPAGAIYMGRVLILLRSGAASFKAPLGTEGSFRVELVPATYTITMDNCDFFGCDVFPMQKTIAAGETVRLDLDFDTGIRTPGHTSDIDSLIAEIIGLGATVAEGEAIDQPFFAVPGRDMIVGTEHVQVFAYASAADAQADANLVDPKGSPIGTSMVGWMAPPHFYLRDDLIAIYVGHSDEVVRVLDHVFGPAFAGVTNVILDDSGPTSDDPQAQMEAYLALMIDLRDALANVGNPDSSRGGVPEATAIATEIATYTPFFQNLSPRALVSLVEFYGEQMQEINADVADHAARLVTMTGTEELEAALLQGPAFALADTSTSPIRQADESEVVESLDSGMLIMPGEETAESTPDMIVELLP
ncbi:MAG: hypothetical protein O2826_08710 [Chloroflexi bacterium]|nr:hypothetical protein [Chloroflexota bacterium]